MDNMGKLLITGDKHGAFLPLFGLAEKEEIQREDVLIIAGDAGYVWDDNYPHVVETLEQTFAGTVVFVDGNHENHAILNRLEVKEWFGGKVHVVGERVYHLMRGECYSIYGNHIFCLGGARSSDKDRREEGISWWREEEPSVAEMAYAKMQFEKYKDSIDYVITHETPLSARAEITRTKEIEADYLLPQLLEEWYQQLCATESFKKWYFGHMHVDKEITPQMRAIHHDILLLGKEEKLSWY